MKNILIADDHAIVRAGIRIIIESQSEKYNIIETTTCTEVCRILSEQSVQYAILDLMLTDGNLFSALQHADVRFVKTNILVFSMDAEQLYAKRLMTKGIKGFLNKTADMEEIERAIQHLLKNEPYLSPWLKNSLLGIARGPEENPFDKLSDRELEVVDYLVTGIGSKEIGRKMNLNITTISTHRRRIFEKLHVNDILGLKELLASVIHERQYS